MSAIIMRFFTTTLASFLRSPAGITLAIAIIWQTVFTFIGATLAPDPAGTLFHMNVWDAGWYYAVINDHYVNNPASAAFYPLFPLTLEAFTTFTGIEHILKVGLVLNTACLWLSLLALHHITAHFTKDRRAPWIAIVLLLASPAAFFMHLLYSEPLFMAIAFWAYLSALRRQWWTMGILLAILTASRLPSLLFIGLCGLEFLRAHKYNLKKIWNKNILAFLLAPLGFIAYGALLFVQTGNFLAMFAAYDATNNWTYQVFNPNIFETFYRSAEVLAIAAFTAKPFNSVIFSNFFVPLVMLGLLIASSIYMLIALKSKGIPLGVFGLVSTVFFTLNSNIVSVHRYILPCIVIYIALTHAYVTYRRLRPIVLLIGLAMFALQALLVRQLYIVGAFVG